MTSKPNYFTKALTVNSITFQVKAWTILEQDNLVHSIVSPGLQKSMSFLHEKYIHSIPTVPKS
jgi:hypothetical protein